MTIKINLGYVVVVVIVASIVAWFYTARDSAPEQELSVDVGERIRVQSLPLVTVENLAFEQIERVLELSARTEEFRQVEVRSEIGGRVENLPVSKGEVVEPGQLLVELNPDDLEARLRQNQAELEFKQIGYEADQRLVAEQLASRSKLAQSASELELARSNLESTELQLAKTKTYAPFAGVLETLDVELGSYLNAGEVIGHIYQYDPMLVVGYINESDVNKLKLGMVVRVELVDSSEVYGKLSFIASSGELDARTYRIEAEVPNRNRRVKAQMSATMYIEFEPVEAFRLSPSILSLDDAGVLGVKAVEDDMLVQFLPVELERMQTNDFWVSGLEPESRVITIGHGFVEVGERVEAYWPGGELVGRASDR